MSTSNSWPRPHITLGADNSHRSYETFAYEGYLVSLSDPNQEETCFTLLSEYNLRSEWAAIATNKEAISAAKKLAQGINEQALLGRAVAVIIQGPFPCETGHYLIIFTGAFNPSLGFVMTRRCVGQKALEIAKTELEKQKSNEQLMTPQQVASFRSFKKKKKELDDEIHRVEAIVENCSERDLTQTEWKQRLFKLQSEKKNDEADFIKFLKSLASGDNGGDEQAQGFVR